MILYESNVAGNFDIYLTDVEGVTHQKVLGSTFAEEQPKWSPDGQWIVFTTNQWKEEGTGKSGLQIAVAILDGQQVQRIRSNANDEYQLHWVDGDLLTFVSRHPGSGVTHDVLVNKKRYRSYSVLIK